MISNPLKSPTLCSENTNTPKMKKLYCMSKIISSPPQNPPSNSLTLASLFSPKTQNPPSSSSSSSTSLYHRIQIIRNPKVSVIPVLEQWVNEQRPVNEQEIRSLVRIMKDFRRFSHALEVHFSLTPFLIYFSFLG
jgi:hypothetical protein